MTAPLLEINSVTRVFGAAGGLFAGRARRVHAVQGVTLSVQRGETLGIVGESGCGKSTLGRMLAGLDAPTEGAVMFDGEDVAALAKSDPKALARKIQYVFQDPVAALNPRKTIRKILEAPLIHLLGMDAPARRARLDELMQAVNLAPEFLDRYPHEFSGGQAQRIGIARALAAKPEMIVLDEPVSALDVSVQAQVLNILDGLKQQFGLTYLFISHDLSVVESVSDRVAVFYFGGLIETGARADIFNAARHPYTHLLLNSAPAPGKKSLAAEDGEAELPDPYNPPPGCAFSARCPNRSDACLREKPGLEAAAGARNHLVACHHPHQTGA